MKYLILAAIVIALAAWKVSDLVDVIREPAPAVEPAVQPRPFRLPRPGPTMPCPDGFTERGRG